MTKQLKVLLSGILLLLLLTALVMIVGKKDYVSRLSTQTEVTVAEQPKMDPGKPADQAGALAPQVQRSVAPQQQQAKTAVSQTQIDLVTKREEARIRRDEMLKVRAETIKDLGPGNTGEQQPQ